MANSWRQPSLLVIMLLILGELRGLQRMLSPQLCHVDDSFERIVQLQ